MPMPALKFAPLGIAIAAGFLGGCHVPTKKPPDISLRTDAPLAGIEQGIAGWPDQKWWKSFDDAQLDTLMDLAQKQSPALDILDARVQLAQAQVDAARANAGPDLNGVASATRSRFSITPKPASGSSSGASGGSTGSTAGGDSSSSGFTLPSWTPSGIVGAGFRYGFAG